MRWPTWRLSAPRAADVRHGVNHSHKVRVSRIRNADRRIIHRSEPEGTLMRRLVPGALLPSAVSVAFVLLGVVPAGAAPATAPTGPVTAAPANTPQLNTT